MRQVPQIQGVKILFSWKFKSRSSNSHTHRHKYTEMEAFLEVTLFTWNMRAGCKGVPSTQLDTSTIHPLSNYFEVFYFEELIFLFEKNIYGTHSCFLCIFIVIVS